MSSSILDTVLSQRDVVERDSFDAVHLMEQILELLPAKEVEVLTRRYGLNGDKKQTLETIGQEYQVTRERIRQIERQAIQYLFENPKIHEIIKPFEHIVVSVIHRHGGIMTMDMIAQELLGVNAKNPKQHAILHFLLSQILKEKIEHVRASKDFAQSWKTHTSSMDVIAQTINELQRIIENLQKPHAFERIHEELKKTDHYAEFQDHLTESVVESYLDVAASIGKNPFNEYGLAHWGLVNPKRMHDRVYLVLQKKGQPMHFEEIAQEIADIFQKKAYPPTVHNELILNKEYVLVGRGLYALKEWGYQEGVVSDVIIEVMKEANEPLDRDEVVKRVLEQRIVKRNTIYLALTDKRVFKKTGDGRYTLIS